MGDMIADNDHLLGRCLDLTGTDKGGMLLFRMYWWSRKAKVEKKGQKWLVRSNEWWAREVRATPKQYRTAVADLKERGLIVSKRFLFAGLIRAHIRLSDKAISALSGDAMPGASGDALQGAIYSKGEVEGSSVMEESEHALATASPCPGEGSGVSGKDEEMKGLKSVKDVEAAVKAQKILHKPDSTTALEFIWKKRVAEITKAPVVFKKLDFHKLTQFRKLCPPGTAEKVLELVLSDWIGFAKNAEEMAGLKWSPALPSIDFLLANVQSAVIFSTPKPPPVTKVAKPAPPPVEAVQVTSPIPEPVIQKPQSLAEIWADDDEDDEAE